MYGSRVRARCILYNGIECFFEHGHQTWVTDASDWKCVDSMLIFAVDLPDTVLYRWVGTHSRCTEKDRSHSAAGNLQDRSSPGCPITAERMVRCYLGDSGYLSYELHRTIRSDLHMACTTKQNSPPYREARRPFRTFAVADQPYAAVKDFFNSLVYLNSPLVSCTIRDLYADHSQQRRCCTT